MTAMQRYLLLALCFAQPVVSTAAEQRCTGLGAVCECSEPLQMTGFAQNGSEWNPDDTSSQQCNFSVAGHPISHNGTPLSGNDAGVLAALPAGHSVSKYLTFADDYTGITILGHVGISSTKERVSHRWYQYWTSDASISPDDGCNTKFVESDPLVWNMTMDTGGNIHMSDTPGKFSPDVDCCLSGPGAAWGSDYTLLKGKWWRIEVVQTGMAGPGYRVIIYGKNVTNNEPEVVITDLYAFRTDLSTVPTITGAHVNMFRANQPGPCTGTVATSHFMAASWDTDAGQRIGAASEIEGSGAPTYLPFRTADLSGLTK